MQACINAVELAIIANSIALDTALKAACTARVHYSSHDADARREKSKQEEEQGGARRIRRKEGRVRRRARRKQEGEQEEGRGEQGEEQGGARRARRKEEKTSNALQWQHSHKSWEKSKEDGKKERQEEEQFFSVQTPYGFRQVVQHVSKHVAFGIN